MFLFDYGKCIEESKVVIGEISLRVFRLILIRKMTCGLGQAGVVRAKSQGGRANWRVFYSREYMGMIFGVFKMWIFLIFVFICDFDVYSEMRRVIMIFFQGDSYLFYW